MSNATANCLNSLSALESALTTTNPAIADANSKNPIWLALGKPLTQVVIPGVTSVDQIRKPNSNLDVFFAVNVTNLYPPVKTSSLSLSKTIQIIYSEFIQTILLITKSINNIALTTIAFLCSLPKNI